MKKVLYEENLMVARCFFILLFSLLCMDLKGQSAGNFEQFYFLGSQGSFSVIQRADLQIDDNWRIEGRHNYENNGAFSLHTGRTFRKEGTFSYSFTPILGPILGGYIGASAGLNVEVGFKNFSFSSEPQYTFSIEDGAQNYFYSRSSLEYKPAKWLRIGVSGQQTRFEAKNTLAKGFVFSAKYKNWTFPVYLFNPTTTDRYYLFGVKLSWKGKERTGAKTASSLPSVPTAPDKEEDQKSLLKEHSIQSGETREKSSENSQKAGSSASDPEIQKKSSGKDAGRGTASPNPVLGGDSKALPDPGAEKNNSNSGKSGTGSLGKGASNENTKGPLRTGGENVVNRLNEPQQQAKPGKAEYQNQENSKQAEGPTRRGGINSPEISIKKLGRDSTVTSKLEGSKSSAGNREIAEGEERFFAVLIRVFKTEADAVAMQSRLATEFGKQSVYFSEGAGYGIRIIGFKERSAAQKFLEKVSAAVLKSYSIIPYVQRNIEVKK